jgi:hypothetical protein
MAILRGFPPSNTISPSVRIAEKDLSFIAPNQSFHRGALVGFASKGPINTPTLISTRRQLNTVFGYPHPDVSDPFLLYAAEQYLNSANELYIVRVADEEAVSNERAESAYVDVPSAGSVVEIISKVPGNYTFAVDSFFRWRLNTVLSSKTLVVGNGVYNANELAAALNDQLDTVNDGIIFFAYTVESNSYIGVKTVWAYGPSSSLELVSVHQSIYGEGAVTGLGTGMTQAEIVATNYGYSGSADDAEDQMFNFSGMSGLNIQIVLDGTDTALIDNVVQVIDLSEFDGMSDVSLGSIVTSINNQKASASALGTLPGGWVAESTTSENNKHYLSFKTEHYGRDARLRVKAVGVAVEVFGMSTSTAMGDSPVQSSAVSVNGGISNSDSNVGGIVVGSDNVGMSQITFTVYADSPGIEGNRTQVKIKNNSYENNFTMEVYSNGVQVESWGNLTKDPASNYYVESYLAQVSDYVRVVDATDISSPPLDSTTYSPLSGAYLLSGGADGIPSDPEKQDDLIVGSALGYTGIYALSEPEQIDIDLIAAPGHSSTFVVQALIDLCQKVRMDCMAIIDPPFGLTVKEIVQWQNGTHPLNNDRFDSDFAALYWPWVKVRDSFNLIDVWAPPSGAVMATIAQSDSLSAPWFAPAGLNRGNVSGILDVYDRPTLEERDLMYGNRNCVNPIIQFVDIGGFVIFGQKTLQRKPTALDRVNVRRLMLTIEKRLRIASRTLLFEPNDEKFRQRFVLIATQILQEIQVGRGVTAFIIKADTELNTPDVIDRNEFRARIGIQPVRAAEFIFLEFSIHRTGSFAETA